MLLVPSVKIVLWLIVLEFVPAKIRIPRFVLVPSVNIVLFVTVCRIEPETKMPTLELEEPFVSTVLFLTVLLKPDVIVMALLLDVPFVEILLFKINESKTSVKLIPKLLPPSPPTFEIIQFATLTLSKESTETPLAAEPLP